MPKFKKGPKCPACWGEGTIYSDKDAGAEDCQCQECFGTGIQANETVENHDPADLKLGIED